MQLYSKIDKASAELLPSGLDYFSTPPTQVAVEKTYEREFLTLNPVMNSPYNFRVLTGTGYMIPNRTRIVTTWTMKKRVRTKDKDQRVVLSDEQDIKSADNINVINGLGATFIRHMKVKLQGEDIFNSNYLYSQFAYMENLLNFSEDSKKSSMTSFGWYHENRGKKKQLEKVKQGDAEVVNPSTGWKARRDLFVDGKTVEFSAPLYADFFQQPLFLLNNMELTFEIYRHDTPYLVIAPKDFDGEIELTLTDIRLFCTFVDLHPGAALEIEKKLEVEPAKIPMNRIQLKNPYFEPVRMDAQQNVFNDYIPDEMAIAFVLKKASVGDLKLDPTYFEHLDMQNFGVVAGNTEIPYVPFDMKIKQNKFVRSFEHFHRTLGRVFRLNGRFFSLKGTFFGLKIFVIRFLG